MKTFNLLEHVEDTPLVLDNGQWSNFHDAEVHKLSIWRGDVRPDDNVWIGTAIEASFELCALQKPCIAVLKFHDCEAIRMQEFNHQKSVYDSSFTYVARGSCNNGGPLTPHIAVVFEQAFAAALTFNCFRVQAVARQEIEGAV